MSQAFPAASARAGAGRRRSRTSKKRSRLTPPSSQRTASRFQKIGSTPYWWRYEQAARGLGAPESLFASQQAPFPIGGPAPFGAAACSAPSLLPSPRRIERIVCTCHKLYLLYNLYNIAMIATKRLAVTESVWAELSDLKRPGETFSQLLEEMIEREKKARLIAHLKTIAEDGDFVELPP